MTFLRPDEIASQSNIERSKEIDRKLKKGAKTVLGVGTAVFGAGIYSKVLPFLSEYITPDLALKGINKISPGLGKILKKGMEHGLNLKDGLNFVKENLSASEQNKTQEKKEPTQENRNIVEQYSPELHQFISSEIAKGRNPLEAGALASLQDKFKKVIDKIRKDHKSDWSSILQSVYGNQQSQGSQNTEQNMQQPGQQKQGGASEKLMAALKAAEEARQRRQQS